ncbi:BTAD domain-containing putative transcriptional regulator (plasmid) [Streptomyces sp. FXJ1.172]|uniref:AfsR/SARP family transcriptional regulator n=1 Tax=Streptomyces sp. FXJ1.172 TaxID=710705 RepID=UPI0023DD1B6D|nr:BTAD domain-containing putative transcriptional regulator [Streptomyces sp. FXJ1.172]WEP00604.1 BTAD domain-containing putative transcriptional regulator [Streptomyces sp. FXJ1.172]
MRNSEASREMDATVRYSILGTVRAIRGNTEIDLGPPKRLALLALLLLRAPGPLTLSEAVDILWDDEPPTSAVNVVHRHIGALRRTLEPDLRSRTNGEHLVRAAGGYRLLVDTSTSDLLRFRDLRAQAQLAVKGGAPAQAAQDFVEALRLWRGPVVAAGTSVARHPVFTSVGHEFVATVKEAADAVLTAAPALTEEVLAVLRHAVDSHPFDEALHSRLIGALAVTGRQAEALRQFENIRGALAEELGVEPGPELRAAQQHLLQRRVPRDPVAAASRAREADGPAQLPADCVSFAGRQQALDQCLELLPLEGESRPPTMTAAICGMAGVGKTTLAVHWGHMVADHFPDGQIYVDLQGHHTSRSPLDPAEAITEVLGALGVKSDRSHSSAAALAAAYRSALSGRRLLLVLDDAVDCEQVRPLLPATPGCLAVVTSRRQMEGLAVTDNARIITLEPMTREEGLELLDRRLGTGRIRAEYAAAMEIVELCGGLPLALAVAATRTLLQPHFPLASLAARLKDTDDCLDALSGRDARTNTRSSFHSSYDALGSSAARLFRLLSLHPSRDITVQAAASLAGTDLRRTRQDVAELMDRCLLVELAAGRYTCHELLRTYARELSSLLDSQTVRSEAVARMFEHYLYSADAATALLAPHRSTVILPPPRPGVRPQWFAGRTDAAEWIVAEQYLLPELVRSISSHHPRGEAFRRQLTSALETCLDSTRF